MKYYKVGTMLFGYEGFLIVDVMKSEKQAMIEAREWGYAWALARDDGEKERNFDQRALLLSKNLIERLMMEIEGEEAA